MFEPEIPVSSPAPLSRNTIFRGPNGIRPGWRVVIFLALSAALMFVCFAALRFFTGRNAQVRFSQLTPFGLSLSDGSILFFTAIPALIMARIEGRSFGEYGLPPRSAFRRDFWTGAVGGFVAISACLLTIFAQHGFRLTGMGIHGMTIIWATAAWCAAFVIVGLAEEFSFRGYLQYTLTTGMGFWPAAILLSLLFAIIHMGNPGETKSGLLSVVIFGLLFCLFLRRTGNLWWAVGFHAGWDWGQTFFYGVPDSGLLPYHNLLNCSFSGPNWLTGGTVGPEASVFTPIVLAIVAVLFALVYREKRYQAG
jgi:uncharacterized protein